MSHEWVEAIAAAISAFLAIAAIVVSIIAMRKQDSLAREQSRLSKQHDVMEKKLASERSDLDKALAKQREDFDNRLQATSRQFSQRQSLFDLWKYISELNRVNPKDPITPDILKGVNALELVGLCCEGGIVDEDLVRRTFRQTYIDLYEQIEQVVEVPGLNMSGKKMLGENPAAQDLYEKFKKEIRELGKLKPVGG